MLYGNRLIANYAGMAHSQEIISAAKERWMAGQSAAEIVKGLKLKNTQLVYAWRDRYGWDKDKQPADTLLAASVRFNLLIEKEAKTDDDYKELDKLADLLLKLEKAAAYRRGDAVGPGGVMGKSRGDGSKRRSRRRKKNEIDHLESDQFAEVRGALLYPHQKIWYEAGRNKDTNLIRFILKSRQIGATYTFSYEAFEAAVLEGRTQIFISSTKAQAEVFKSYITIIAKEHFDVELSGNPCKLSNGAELHFLSPNGYAQSRSGDVYFDEVFWTRSFAKMEELAAPMATLEGCKTTYFSTPSAISHEAYEIWSGERFKRYKPDTDIDVSDHASMRYGRLFADGIWRCVCTVHDAIDMGWDKANIEHLRLKTPDPERFKNIYECKFVDDTNSVFKLSDLLNCAVNTLEWDGYDANSPHPVGTTPCTSGYDPAGVGDNASFVVMTRPANSKEAFRLIKKSVWKGIRAPVQCGYIQADCDTFNIEYMEIDSTGPGFFVGDFVETFFPVVTRAQYSPEYKARLVQKAQSVIAQGRFQYCETDTNLALAFLTVHQATTDKGVITYASSHNEKVGHGDEAWATMHAMMCEPLFVSDRTITMETY